MRSRVLVLCLLAAVAALGGGTTAGASVSGVVISQVYGGGGNSGATFTNDFIELYNAGPADVSLDGWSVQYASAAGSTWQVTALSGTIPAGRHYLVQQAAGSGGTVALPAPDATGTTMMAAASGKVALVNSTTALTGVCPLASSHDFVGYGAASCFETSPAPGLSNTTAALRLANGATDTDNNQADFVSGAPNPRNCNCAADAAPTVSSTSPTAGATEVARNANVSITFSEPVAVTGSWYSIDCAVSGMHTATASGGPTTFQLDPHTDFAMGESCTVTVVAANVTDLDTNDPPDAMAANRVFGFQTVDLAVCGDPATKIPAIQGEGNTAATTGAVSVEGLVVGDFEGATTSGLQGFYLQDPAGDGNPLTSDGIFVFTGNNASVVSSGQRVRVSGFARERFDQTAIMGSATSNSTGVTNILDCGTGTVGAVDVSMPFATMGEPERYEGMLVRFPQSLAIAEYFNFERFGELVLGLPLPGETRPFTPTSIVEPGAPAQARLLQNQLRRITLDDGLGSQNPPFLRHPDGEQFTLLNRFRGGDTVANAVGVIGHDFSIYRIQPTGPADYTPVNPRPAAPAAVGGTLKTAAMNTLNFFITGDFASSNPLDNKCGPAQNVECRGHDADQPNEFTRQRAKLVAAIGGLGADVVGLNELENTTGVDALTHPDGLVPALNAALGAGTYEAIETDVIGTDAIRVGLIYKPAKVAPVGDFEVLDSTDDPRFIDTRSRPALAQTFEELATGARFTIVVNHLKSKGSACDDIGDPDTGDGQGNCNQTRLAAARALVDWLASDPTGSGDSDFLIAGDLNAYAMEDPIDAIKAGPDDTAGTADDYTNLVAKFLGPYAYSFVFDGMAGYLDHALSNASLTPQVTGLTEWHINADEPDIFDYDTSFKPDEQDALFEPNAYRSSDHDPVLTGLDLVVTFADLRRLVIRDVDDPDVESSLLAKLDAAESAQARGNDKAMAGALRAFVNLVKAQTGKTIDPADAARLIAGVSDL